MKNVRLITKNKDRLQEILKPGDKVSALVFHKKSGFTGTFRVRAISHWGVYATIRGTDLNYYCRSYKTSIKEEIEKRQFLIKWKHISSFELL